MTSDESMISAIRTLMQKHDDRMRDDILDDVVEILHNHYDVRNPEQNEFMDLLCAEVVRKVKYE